MNLAIRRLLPHKTSSVVRYYSSAEIDVEQRKQNKKDKNEVEAEILEKSKYPPVPLSPAMERRAKIIASSKPKSIFSYRPMQPVNFSLPNEKGVEFFEESMRVGDIPKEMNEFKNITIEKVKEEFKERIQFDHPELGNDIWGTKHNQLSVEYHFKDDKQMARWQTGCDSDWGEGFSTVKLERTERGTAMFSGYLDTTILKNGRIERAGWCTMKSVDIRALNRKSYKRHWCNYNQLLIKCRGDGRSYKVILYIPGSIDVNWGDCFSYPLHTHGGPYWQYYRIPYSRFFQTIGGRILDQQQALPTNMISNIGIVLMDRIDGRFSLEIDYIGVATDVTHDEERAYEAYSIPVFNTNSI
ncbi:unnamed protein product [Bursaphelenchus okinawaensis]|uniref:NADH:ubiquinone oxidoreductase intermediate-associated protein 30 domain-containing protein n=1 Tax=Bursaphelenchus okinawaensis TaxID=465554 RepID=A0A811L7D9_9BILA|nr:unnamed protein product [Bursaphelenchus okinawaensis]CAG9119703.1 unnamed protein product [Bursaphelenchus okinawaensis]